jgi:DNA-directed RNA polymerase subunit RPC12/RpoP
VKNKNDFTLLPDPDKICSINESGDAHRMEYLKSLVGNPEYICSTCGRAASSQGAICSPEGIKERAGHNSSDSPDTVISSDFEIPDYEKACFINDYDSSLRMQLLKDMAENARFVCAACGRAASRESDVCSPEEL